MSYQPPCADPKNDPNDWFITRDGKQYPDDALVFNKESLVADAHANGDDRPDEEILAEAERDALKAALQRRRHAKDICFTECYIRTRCLDIALFSPDVASHGTWGGYTEEELRELRRQMRRRRRVVL